MYKTLREEKEDLWHRLIVLILMIGVLLTIGMVVYHFSEGWGYLDSLYFATISLTTRGYSSMHPTTWFSILFSIFYLLIGVSMVLYAISSLIAYYTAYYQKGVERRVRSLMDGVREKTVKQPTWVTINRKKSGESPRQFL